MDRTLEFHALVAAAGGGSSRAPAPAAYGADVSASAFTRAAAQVGRDLHATSAKVQQLTLSASGGRDAPAACARARALPPLNLTLP
jgi:hypothetical protein